MVIDSLTKLRKEVAKLKKDKLEKERKLKNYAKSKKEITQIGEERKRLMKEIKELKSPKSSAFKRNLKRGMMTSGKKTFGFLSNVVEAFDENDRPRQRPKRRPRSQRRQGRRK